MEARICKICGGTGKYKDMSRNMVKIKKCHECDGEGWVGKKTKEQGFYGPVLKTMEDKLYTNLELHKLLEEYSEEHFIYGKHEKDYYTPENFLDWLRTRGASEPNIIENSPKAIAKLDEVLEKK